eukprot:122325_1
MSQHQFASLHAVAGAGGGMLSMAFLYPLENIRTRLQVQVLSRSTSDRPSDDSPQIRASLDALRRVSETFRSFGGLRDCVAGVIAEEGARGLYAGMGSSVMGVGISSFVYFYWYNLFKHMLIRKQRKHIGPVGNIVVAAAAGIHNVFVTAPFWLVTSRLALQSKKKTLTKRKYDGICDAVKKIYLTEGPSAFWDGLVPSLLLVANPIIQFVSYEQLSLIVSRWNRTNGSKGHLTAVQTFILGAIAKAIATLATYPTQVLKTRLQVDPKGEHRVYKDVKDAILSIYREEGLIAFYSGMSAKMSQTVLNSAFMFTAYERILRMIIISYLFLRKRSAQKSV